jgi:hypothetical protein
VTGPADGRAAALLRVSHADREQAVDVLKVAFVQGRLPKEEFDTRVGHAFAARTGAELAILTADIPPGPPPSKPAKPVRPRTGKPARRPAYVPVVAATTALTAALWTVVLAAPVNNPVVTLLLTASTFVCVGLLILTGAVSLESKRQRPHLRPKRAASE